MKYKKITINFEKNGADSISKAKETCRLEKGKTTCTIKMADINRSTSDIIGWSTNKNATTAEIKPGSEIEVNKDATYYAITRKNITINFNKNGADSEVYRWLCSVAFVADYSLCFRVSCKHSKT